MLVPSCSGKDPRAMRTFTTIFGTGFTVLLLAATAQAGGGKVVTPPSAGLVAGLPPELSYILKRFYDCVAELSKGHTAPGTHPNDPHANDCPRMARFL